MFGFEKVVKVWFVNSHREEKKKAKEKNLVGLGFVCNYSQLSGGDNRLHK